MRLPEKGERLVAADGEVWLVVRTHHGAQGLGHFALDVIRLKDVRNTSRAVNYTWDEFSTFCTAQGIAWPKV
jgi:hypothetical protein